jgi:hypothetical protein
MDGARPSTGMIALGYGRFVRADRVFAVIPVEGPTRGDGHRTYVHVEGLAEPLVASRSERAIMADLNRAAVLDVGAAEGPAEPSALARRHIFRRHR